MIPNIISPNWLLPFVAQKNDFSRAIRGLRGMPRRLLLVGLKANSGIAATGTVININSQQQADLQFGARSMLAHMWRVAKANAGQGLPIDCIAVQFSGGGNTAAVGKVRFGNVTVPFGNFATPGNVAIYVGDTRYSLAYGTSDTPMTLTARAIAAVNADPSSIVTATAGSTTSEMVLTLNFAGEIGNMLSLREGYYPEERLTDQLSTAVDAFEGGSGQPNMANIAAAMVGYRATEIVCPFSDSAAMLALETEMARRWEAADMQDGQVITAVRANETLINNWLSQRNSPHVHCITTRGDCTPPWLTAAMAGAAIESLAAIDPTLPVTGIKLVGYLGPVAAARMSDDEANALLSAGGMPLRVAPDGTGYLQRAVTTYTQTLNGAADRSMAELAWIKTMSYYRWFHVTEFQIKYEGFKLAQYLDEPIPGQKIMTKDLAQEIMLGLYKLLCDAGICQNPSYYEDTLQIEIDAPKGRLKIVDEPVIVTQHYGTEITSYVVAGQV
jgi:phage tail sheath gpL-like